ncbi:hypothetical protein BKA63DRAFT_25414 [Paraphoma chrysanthemicola]|nr:hypothetical protein BKA63DRAFT_25414 [Paraphoma chrysanthemicola]
MSFGFSAGDFITFGKLVGEITTSLRDVSGAKSEYQQLIRELSSLESALRQLDRLKGHTTEAEDVNAIKYAALNCRHSLEDFQKRTSKYERSLDVRSKANAIRSTSDKLRWTLAYDDDVKRLRAHLNVQTGTIVMVLTKIGIERLDAHNATADLDAEHVRTQLDNTKTMLGNIQRNLPAQALMVGQVHSMLGGLCNFVYGEIKTAIQHFSQVVDKVYVKAEEIHTLVLDLRNSRPQVDTRWTYFQEPFIVEDALGAKFPVPSEYDFTMLDGLIRIRFRAGAGSLEVDAGKYELCQATRRSEVVTPKSRLRPGTAITMAILMDTPNLSERSCPMPRCGSTQASAFPGGGFVW